MIWENLKDTLVQTDLRAENEQEIFEQLGGVLVSEGYCKESYVKALSEREKVYPTGVLAGNIGVAIPHTDPCYVPKAERAGIIFSHGNQSERKCESPGEVCHDAGNRGKTAFGSASESHSFNTGCRDFENACKRRESGGNHSNHQK